MSTPMVSLGLAFLTSATLWRSRSSHRNAVRPQGVAEVLALLLKHNREHPFLRKHYEQGIDLNFNGRHPRLLEAPYELRAYDPIVVVHDAFIKGPKVGRDVAMRLQDLQPGRKDGENRSLIDDPCTVCVGKHVGVGVLRRDESNVSRSASLRVLLEERLEGRHFFEFGRNGVSLHPLILLDSGGKSTHHNVLL